MLRPVVRPEESGYSAVSDHELSVGREHAQREYGIDPDPDLLRLCTNTTLQRRKQNRQVILAFLAATVVRETIPPHTPNRVEKIQAFKGAVMKIMSARSAIKRARDAEKRKQGIEVPLVPKQVDHPDDNQRVVTGGTQLLLL